LSAFFKGKGHFVFYKNNKDLLLLMEFLSSAQS